MRSALRCTVDELLSVESLLWTRAPFTSAALFSSSSSSPPPPPQQQQPEGTSPELLVVAGVCVAVLLAMLVLTVYCACCYVGGGRRRKRPSRAFEYGACSGGSGGSRSGARDAPDAGTLIKRVDVDYGQVYESYSQPEQRLANSMLR